MCPFHSNASASRVLLPFFFFFLFPVIETSEGFPRRSLLIRTVCLRHCIAAPNVCSRLSCARTEKKNLRRDTGAHHNAIYYSTPVYCVFSWLCRTEPWRAAYTTCASYLAILIEREREKERENYQLPTDCQSACVL